MREGERGMTVGRGFTLGFITSVVYDVLLNLEQRLSNEREEEERKEGREGWRE